MYKNLIDFKYTQKYNRFTVHLIPKHHLLPSHALHGNCYHTPPHLTITLVPASIHTPSQPYTPHRHTKSAIHSTWTHQVSHTLHVDTPSQPYTPRGHTKSAIHSTWTHQVSHILRIDTPSQPYTPHRHAKSAIHST